MPLVLAIFAAIPAIISLVTMIVNGLKKTPEEKRQQFLDNLNDAMKKATNDKNPEDLSKLINGL